MVPKSAKPRKEYDIQFVACDMVQADKKDFEVWMADYEAEFSTLIGTLLDEGYRITIKFDFNNSCYTCSMTQQDDKHENSGKLLSARSDDPLECFWMVLYKHVQMLQQGSWPTQTQRSLWG